MYASNTHLTTYESKNEPVRMLLFLHTTIGALLNNRSVLSCSRSKYIVHLKALLPPLPLATSKLDARIVGYAHENTGRFCSVVFGRLWTYEHDRRNLLAYLVVQVVFLERFPVVIGPGNITRVRRFLFPHSSRHYSSAVSRSTVHDYPEYFHVAGRKVVLEDKKCHLP